MVLPSRPHLAPGRLTLKVAVTGSPKVSDRSSAMGTSRGADAAVAGTMALSLCATLLGG